MTFMKRTVVAALLAIAVPWIGSGQAKRSAFEVASVKRNTVDEFPDFTPRRSGDRITMHSVRLASVVIYAYHLANGRATTSYQLAGNLQLPEGWDVYDIDAIAPGSPSDGDLRLMFQTLLEDRFKLKVHRETRELPMYDLVIAKNGPKLKATAPDRKVIAENRPVDAEPGVSHLVGRGTSIEQLVGALSGRLDTPVRNLTGLTGGAYDYNVPFARDGILLGIAFAFGGFPGESSHPHGTDPTTIRVDSNLVLVPVTVTDNRGKLVAGLLQADFTLLEDGKLQQLRSLSRENAPISLGIVVDLSGSMANKLGKTLAAVNEFLSNLEPEDEEFLVTFADTPELRVPFTSDQSAIRTALAGTAPRGSTALFDAVALAMRQMRTAHNDRRVLFLVSDGGDNHSRYTEHELLKALEEADLQIHAIGIHDGMAGMNEKRGPWILEDLAEMTGGQHHMVRNIGELPAIAARMSLALHDRYLLGYRPTPLGQPGKFRKIEVKVRQPKGTRLSVYARRGYRMP